MSSSYVNDLRLEEIGTGDQSGTWGTTTNTNLELIGEALGYGTQDCFTSDADATTTVADGATDPARSMYFKVTSSATLTATRTLTIAPNTISRVMFIENATTGSQSITISQGSGANVTIATGKTAVVYLDGAGSTAAVVDAMALVDPGVTDTLAEVLVAGNTSGGTNIELTTTDKVQFRDTAIYINSSADGQLDIVADTEVQIATTTVDLNGILDVSGNTTLGADVTFTGASYNVVWDSSDSALEFADNAKAVFGAGSDLEIYHDGSDSYISDQGSGTLKIQGDGQVRLESTAGERYFVGNNDGAARLYYDDSEKLATTATGIDVTGTVTADTLDIDSVKILSGQSTTPTNDASSFIYRASGHADYANGDLIIQARSNASRDIYMLTGTTTPVNRLQVNGNGDISFYEDTGTTAKFFWDASAETLSIGDPSADNVTIYSTDDVPRLEFEQGGTVYADIGHRGASAGARQNIFEITTKQSEPMAFRTNNIEAARIDSSQNFLVGKTSTGAATAGIELNGANDLLRIARDGGVLQELNRITNDGDIIEFRKDNTAVGSIGAKDGDIYIAHSDVTDSGLRFRNARIQPCNDTGGLSDASVDLGQSIARFKDLYLSGGVYLGGTTSANLLDDYEEGTFTPTVSSGVTSPAYTSQTGSYTKIGNLVYFQFRLDLSSGTANGDHFKFGGLPFTTANIGNYGGAWISYSAGFLDDLGTASWHLGPNATDVFAYEPDGSAMTGTELEAIGNVLGNVYVNGVYRV